MQQTKENGSLALSYTGYRTAEMDALGNDVGDFDPYATTTEPPSESPGGGLGIGVSPYTNYEGGGSGNALSRTYQVDRMRVSESYFMAQINTAGFGGMFGRAAGNILGSAIPMAGGTGAAIAGSVTASAIYTAASMSETVKSKDEITLDIRMTNSGAVVLTKQLKAKAKSDGEDIISPLIEQAAQAIVDAAAKR